MPPSNADLPPKASEPGQQPEPGNENELRRKAPEPDLGASEKDLRGKPTPRTREGEARGKATDSGKQPALQVENQGWSGGKASESGKQPALGVGPPGLPGAEPPGRLPDDRQLKPAPRSLSDALTPKKPEPQPEAPRPNLARPEPMPELPLAELPGDKPGLATPQRAPEATVANPQAPEVGIRQPKEEHMRAVEDARSAPIEPGRMVASAAVPLVPMAMPEPRSTRSREDAANQVAGELGEGSRAASGGASRARAAGASGGQGQELAPIRNVAAALTGSAGKIHDDAPERQRGQGGQGEGGGGGEGHGEGGQGGQSGGGGQGQQGQQRESGRSQPELLRPGRFASSQRGPAPADPLGPRGAQARGPALPVDAPAPGTGPTQNMPAPTATPASAGPAFGVPGSASPDEVGTRPDPVSAARGLDSQRLPTEDPDAPRPELLRSRPQPQAPAPPTPPPQARRTELPTPPESKFMSGSQGPASHLMHVTLPGEQREISTVAIGERRITDLSTRATGAPPRGTTTGGRPVTSNVPVYNPTLDQIHSIRGNSAKQAVEEIAPLKMALSGSVGTMESTATGWAARAFNPPETEQKRGALPQSRSEKSFLLGLREEPTEEQAKSHAEVLHEMGEQTHLAGTMSQLVRPQPPRELSKPSASQSQQLRPDSQARSDLSPHQVIGEDKREGSGGGQSGGQQGKNQGQSQSQTAPAPPTQTQGGLTQAQRANMAALRTSTQNEIFRLSLNRQTGQAGPPSQALTELASRHASHSIEAILKKAYREQEAGDLDEDTAVNSLGLVLKMGGEFTYAHSARVLEFSMELADELGIKDQKSRQDLKNAALLKDIGEMGLLLSQEDPEKLEKMGDFLGSQDMLRAGLLHDIGKVRIPPEILYKPGRLTEEEYDIMKMHPIYGEQILYPIASLRHLCPAVRGHHERWDGKGYPDGLKGEEIPYSARIIAVADVFDALAAPRPYKPGMEIEKVRSILLEGRGTHFDPELLDAFMRVLDRRYPELARRRMKNKKPE